MKQVRDNVWCVPLLLVKLLRCATRQSPRRGFVAIGKRVEEQK